MKQENNETLTEVLEQEISPEKKLGQYQNRANIALLYGAIAYLLGSALYAAKGASVSSMFMMFSGTALMVISIVLFAMFFNIKKQNKDKHKK